MNIGKARDPRICEDLGKMKNEDSRGLIRLYKGMYYVPKFQDILHRSKHLKIRRNKGFQHQTTLTCAQHTDGGARRQ